MSECVVVQQIAEAGLRVLSGANIGYHVARAPDLEVLRPELADARAVITRNLGFSAAMIEAAPRLRVISSHGTGVDAIDVDAARERGISVLNTAGSNARAVAEHTLALIFACAKHIATADGAVRAGRFAIRDDLRTIELAGRSLGLVGYGHIARLVAQLGAGLGLRVLVCSRRDVRGELAGLAGARQENLESLLAQADILSLHAVPISGVKLDAAAIGRMKPGAILINTARGALVEEAALVDALESGHLSAAGIDVYEREPFVADHPLARLPQVVLTPHIGGSSREALQRTAVAAARNVVSVLRGSPETA